MTDQCSFNGPMARVITNNRHLDIYNYEVLDDRLVIDREMEYYDKDAMNHEYSDVFPLKRCMYGGVELKCPQNPKKFLDVAYGRDVMVPNKKCINSKWVKQ